MNISTRAGMAHTKILILLLSIVIIVAAVLVFVFYIVPAYSDITIDPDNPQYGNTAGNISSLAQGC